GKGRASSDTRPPAAPACSATVRARVRACSACCTLPVCRGTLRRPFASPSDSERGTPPRGLAAGPSAGSPRKRLDLLTVTGAPPAPGPVVRRVFCSSRASSPYFRVKTTEQVARAETLSAPRPPQHNGKWRIERKCSDRGGGARPFPRSLRGIFSAVG